MVTPAGETLERLSRAIGKRYAVVERLGARETATVFLARDLKHDREVAIKVLHPKLTETVVADDFLREIRIGAKLVHPHILPLFDSGAADGFLYYVMPYVAGESLRELLKRETRLPLEQSRRLVCEVADALTYAHARDVVHRDIQPQHILLEDEHAVVSDFGVLHAVKVSGHPEVAPAGRVVGSPEYMSPEQARGSIEPDGRSDVYALGCLLYEMLTGQPPFTGATPEAVLADHASKPVPSLRELRPEVPEQIERAIEKALAKDPADRYATVDEFVDGALCKSGRSWLMIFR